MDKEKIEKILIKYKLTNLEKEPFIKKLILQLSNHDRNEYIYPSEDMYWLYKEDKDFIYALLDAMVKEKILKRYIIFRCCRCGKEKIIDRYLLNGEEIICEECGADNDDTDCMSVYQIL